MRSQNKIDMEIISILFSVIQCAFGWKKKKSC